MKSRKKLANSIKSRRESKGNHLGYSNNLKKSTKITMVGGFAH
jgi:hypothetical protein